jgi:hypothetical protein
MIFEIDRETVNFVSSKKITFNQFIICLLIYQRDAASIIQYTNDVGIIGDCLIPLGDGKYIREIEDLINRGFIKTTKEGVYDLDYLIVTTKFSKGLFDELDVAAREAFELYPKYIRVNTQDFEAKACDFEDFAKKYLLAIGGSIKEHKDIVMPHIKALRKSGYAKMKIMNYIGSKNWKGEKVNEPKSRIY